MSTSTATLPAAAPTAVQRHHARSFWLVAYVFATTMAFNGAPAPLYVLYAKEDGFGSFALTVIFAVYAFGVAVSLYLAGHLSDHFGRRRVLATAVLINVLAGLMFVTWHELAWLLIARFVSGLGVGMLTATATAHIAELHRTARPGRSMTLSEVVGTAANIGGIGLGPLVAGLLAQFAPRPLFTTYIVFLFLLVVGALFIVTVPETVDTKDDDWRYRPQRVSVPSEASAGFGAAAVAAFVGFAMFGFFTSLAPSFLSGTLHHTSHALAGLISFVVFGSAALAQIATARWRPALLYAAGLVALAIGLVLVVTAILTTTLWLLIVAGVVVGTGSGVSFKGAIASVIAIAPPSARSETLAGLFLIAYVGMAVPVVLLGITLQYVATNPSIIAFGILMLVLLAVAASMIGLGRRSRTS